MKYRLSSRAQTDIKNIFKYTVKNFGETQAGLYLGGLDYFFDLLTEYPGLGKSGKNYTRSYLYKSHSVIYRVERDTVIILRVLHSRMKLP